MITKFEGFILSETPYGDTSKIINILTKEKGIIGVMCANAKSIKNPLRAKTLKYTYGTFHIMYKENKLSKLIDVDIINPLKEIKDDIELIGFMTYLSDLTYQVVKQGHSEEIYDLFINALLKINDHHDPLIITNIIELKYLDFSGASLNLDSCIKCGNKTKIVTLNPDEGGFICQDCYQGEKLLDPKTIKLIRMYYLIEINSISEIKIKKETALEINYFIDKYYERYTGYYLKSKDMLKKLSGL